jgi:membrane protein DedA with SNARE-associated domain
MDLLLAEWGIALVFVAVLVEQAGLPLPAAPLLVGAGALAQQGLMRPELVLAVALAASLAADHIWFLAGRRRGRALLGFLCRVSLSPDTCVRRTDDLIARHGPALLLVAKFVPGVSAVAIPTSAAMGLSYRRFLGFDGLGCLVWAGSYVGLGMIFSREVGRVLEAMSAVGAWSLAMVAALFGAYVAAKALHRARLRHLHRLVRIAPEELAMLRDTEPGVVILDARSQLAREEDPRLLPGAIVFEGDALPPVVKAGHTVVTFCTCPNEASAAVLAERLLKAGHERVRVLTGGSRALDVLAVSA